MTQAQIISINISSTKGVVKKPVDEGCLEPEVGLVGDAHSGPWHRQLSLLAMESIDFMRRKGAKVNPGDFAENVTTHGIELHTLPVGTRLKLGEVEVEVTQIGKECPCRLRDTQAGGGLHHAPRGHLRPGLEPGHGARRRPGGAPGSGRGVVLMGEVQAMGGKRCTYYVRQRCTRTVSPEQSEAVRCQLLETRRQVGAATLDRLDRVKNLADPGDREVARRHVIQKNLDEITRLNCPRYVPKNGVGPICQHLHLISCLLLLPHCTGQCEHFMARRDPKKDLEAAS